ncbi:TPA: hypothetical protein G8N69_004839 [Salmonella enterica]|nr:hypothetical protein [Salmonella enterica]
MTYSRLSEGNMRNVCFRLSDNDYNILKEKLPCTVPAYFKSVAEDFIKKVNAGVSVNGWQLDSLIVNYNNEEQNNVLKTYVTDSQKNAIEKAAKKHGWSISREIRHRLQTTLSNRLDMFDEELLAFRKTKNSINKLGTNLHFILKNDNGKILDKNGFMDDVTNLQKEIEQLKKQLDQYILLSQERQKKNRVE